MKPLPWSYSALDDFKNCPRAYHQKTVLKAVPKTDTSEQVWGRYVHEKFEDRLGNGVVLPPELEEHEPYMQQLDALSGSHFAETKIALDRRVKPCHFFARDVWWRGIIDYQKVADTTARIVDHKTGKPHSKFEQLTIFALHTFEMFPNVHVVDAEFYWTTTKKTTSTTFKREQVPAMWAKLVPDLRQYAQAFHEDVWQPRQSGLCRGWCPVTSCEFWSPKRKP